MMRSRQDLVEPVLDHKFQLVERRTKDVDGRKNSAQRKFCEPDIIPVGGSCIRCRLDMISADFNGPGASQTLKTDCFGMPQALVDLAKDMCLVDFSTGQAVMLMRERKN